MTKTIDWAPHYESAAVADGFTPAISAHTATTTCTSLGLTDNSTHSPNTCTSNADSYSCDKRLNNAQASVTTSTHGTNLHINCITNSATASSLTGLDNSAKGTLNNSCNTAFS